MKATHCPILYDQAGLLIISKPEAVLSHPNPGQNASGKNKSAFNGPYDSSERCFQTPEGPVWLLHRLDQDTSGILVACRNASLAQKLRSLFDENKIKKIYTALVMGEVRPAKGAWYDHIAIHKKSDRIRSRVMMSLPANAKLRYEITRYSSRYRLTLMELELMTGKTHQIRVQAAYRAHPIVGDEIYGNFPFNKKLRKEIGLRRLFLHASCLEMDHPETGEPLRILSPLPEDLKTALKKISS